VKKLSTGAAAAALGLSLMVGRADAAVTIDIAESGGNVVSTASGTIDLTDLTLFSTGGNTIADGAVVGADGVAYVGLIAEIDLYSGVSGPASFGSGGVV
jgi:hypothetical protein